ncbi:MAG: PrsW family glutamic-type intramembrane protease, partial [bacterium]
MEPVVFLWLILTFAGVGIAGILVLKVKPGKEAVNSALLASLSSFFLVPFVLWVENTLTEHLYAPISTLTFYAPHWHAFFHAFAIAALTEEGLKYLVLFGIFYRSPLRNIQEGMFVGGMQGITFAVMENTLYLFLSSALPQPSEIVSSRVIPLFAHTLIGFWMGYLFIQVRSSRWPSEQVAQLMIAFFFPFLLHGGYDYLAFQPTAITSVSLIVLLLLIFFSILVLGWLKEAPEVSAPSIVRLLDAEDPISAILNSPPQLEQRRRLCQQLLLESGISDYILINLFSQSPEGMVFEALHLPSRSLKTVKLLSNWKIQAEGVRTFEDLVEFLKKYPQRGIISYSDFRHNASFTLVARPFGEMTLSDYANMGIPEAEQREILSTLFGIISELWKQGLEHGRLTPDNIILYQGEIHLADVGMKLIIPDREKHKEFVRRGALYSGIRGDMYSLSRIASWLTGGYVHITTAEAGRPYSPEQVEKEVMALAVPEDEKKILSQKILERASGWSQKGRELLALWMGLRSQNLHPFPESEHLLTSIGESILQTARQMLASQDYPNALRLFSRALSVLPHKAELVTAQLEKTVEEFILRGDYAFFSRKDIASARRYYESALQVGPLSDLARKKMEHLESAIPFSWSALALIAFFAFSFSFGSLLLLSSLKARGKHQIITAVNPQRTGS